MSASRFYRFPEPARSNPDNNMSFCRDCGWFQEHAPVYGMCTLTGNTVYVDHVDHPEDDTPVDDPFGALR